MELFGDMIRAMVNDRDTARYREIVERIGMLRPGTPGPIGRCVTTSATSTSSSCTTRR